MLRKIPLITDLLFACVLLPALCFLLPIERWIANNLTFVCILACWLYAVYFFNRYITVPMFFQTRRKVIIALILILATILITWLISQYQMDFPHRPVRPRRVRTVARARLHQQAVWFLYVATITFSTAVGLLTELIRQIVRSHASRQRRRKRSLLSTRHRLILISFQHAQHSLRHDCDEVAAGGDGLHAVYLPDEIHVHQPDEGGHTR